MLGVTLLAMNVMLKLFFLKITRQVAYSATTPYMWLKNQPFTLFTQQILNPCFLLTNPWKTTKKFHVKSQFSMTFND